MTAPTAFDEMLGGLRDARENAIASAALWLAPFMGGADERKAVRGVRRRAASDTDFLYPWLSRDYRRRIVDETVDRTKARALELAVAGGIPAPRGTA